MILFFLLLRYSRGIIHAMRTIAKEEGGGRALYRGMGTAIAERFPNMAVNFAAYDILRDQFAQRGVTGLVPSLVNGALAGMISTTMTYPMDVVMRNLQVDVDRKYSGPLDCIRSIHREAGGMKGFYRGLGPQLAKAVPYTTASWGCYDLCKRYLHFEVR